jgi:hypothetical protein
MDRQLPGQIGENASAWDRALYAFLAEKKRRSGSRRTVEGYSRMLQHFFLRQPRQAARLHHQPGGDGIKAAPLRRAERRCSIAALDPAPGADRSEDLPLRVPACSIQHPTSNIQHPTSRLLTGGCSNPVHSAV